MIKDLERTDKASILGSTVPQVEENSQSNVQKINGIHYSNRLDIQKNSQKKKSTGGISH